MITKVGEINDYSNPGEVRGVPAGNPMGRARHGDGSGSSYLDVPLYGEAAAIRDLYQSAFLTQDPPQPPRRGRPARLAPLLDALKAALAAPFPTRA